MSRGDALLELEDHEGDGGTLWLYIACTGGDGENKRECAEVYVTKGCDDIAIWLTPDDCDRLADKLHEVARVIREEGRVPA